MSTPNHAAPLNSTIVRFVRQHNRSIAPARKRAAIVLSRGIMRALYGMAALLLIRGMFLLPQFFGHNIFSSAQSVSTLDLIVSAGMLAIGAIGVASLGWLKRQRKPPATERQ